MVFSSAPTRPGREKKCKTGARLTRSMAVVDWATWCDQHPPEPEPGRGEVAIERPDGHWSTSCPEHPSSVSGLDPDSRIAGPTERMARLGRACEPRRSSRAPAGTDAVDEGKVDLPKGQLRLSGVISRRVSGMVGRRSDEGEDVGEARSA